MFHEGRRSAAATVCVLNLVSACISCLHNRRTRNSNQVHQLRTFINTSLKIADDKIYDAYLFKNKTVKKFNKLRLAQRHICNL